MVPVNGFREQVDKLKAHIVSQICDEVGTRFREALLFNNHQLVGPLAKEIIAAILPEILSSITALLPRSLDSIRALSTENCPTIPTQPHRHVSDDPAASAQFPAEAMVRVKNYRSALFCSYGFLSPWMKSLTTVIKLTRILSWVSSVIFLLTACL